MIQFINPSIRRRPETAQCPIEQALVAHLECFHADRVHKSLARTQTSRVWHCKAGLSIDLTEQKCCRENQSKRAFPRIIAMRTQRTAEREPSARSTESSGSRLSMMPRPEFRIAVVFAFAARSMVHVGVRYRGYTEPLSSIDGTMPPGHCGTGP